jgi:hypothetical protein
MTFVGALSEDPGQGCEEALLSAPVSDEAPVSDDAQVFGAVQVAAEVPIPDDALATDESDADLLKGLGALADLLSNASETLNQCLLTIEGKLSAAAIAREEWIPIQTACSAVERVAAGDERKRSQERVFGGVSVTILQLSAPTTEQPAPKRCEWRYELGYSVADDNWVLMIRSASLDSSNERNGAEIADLMLLRDAPLEIRLKAIREIPSLMQVLQAPIYQLPETQEVVEQPAS